MNPALAESRMSEEFRHKAQVVSKQYIIELLASMNPSDVTKLFVDVGLLIKYSQPVADFYADLGEKLKKDFPEEMRIINES